MLYNKSKNRKVEDKKVLHKIRKKWVVVSSALLMALGGYAAVTHTSAVHADVNGSNNANQNIDHNQENVSQLTNNAGKSLNSQKTNSQSNNVHHDNNITDQARQLHSQIIQNSIQNSNGANVQQTSSASSSVNSSSAVSSSSSSVAFSNAQDQSLSAMNDDHQSNHAVVNLGQMPKRTLGDTVNTSDVGYISILYKDVDKEDPSGRYGQILGQQNNAQPGIIGRQFTQSDKESFMNQPPRGYKVSGIEHDVLYYTSTPQKFIIGIIPQAAKNKASDTRNRIVIEYIDDDNDNTVDPHSQQILNKPDSDHWTYSDKTGKPFGTIPYETNAPQGYALDIKGTEEVSNEQPSGQYSSDETYQPMQDPHVTYKPGTQLIKISVKPAAKVNINYVDTANNQTIAHYTDTGATENPFTNATSYETPRDQGGRMPSGYHMVGQPQNVPSEYINNATMTIDVAADGSNNSGKTTPTSDWVTVDYVDSSTGQPIPGSNPLKFNGTNGQQFKPSDINVIKSQVPYGYQFAYFTPNSTPTYTPNGAVNAVVNKVNQNNNDNHHQPSDQNANMEIKYVNQSDGAPVTSTIAPGTKNQAFNSDQFKNSPYMPPHYHFVKYQGQVPRTYNGSTLVMEVDRNMATMPVEYVEKNTRNVVGHGADLKGASDTSISSSQIMPLEESVSNGGQVPLGFNFDSFENGQPSTYVNNQPVLIYVDAVKNNNGNNNNNNHQQPQLVNVPIHYINSSDGQTVGTASDYGINGKPFTDRSQQYVPSGYTYGKVIGSLPANYGSNETVTVLVNKVPNNNSNNNGNQYQQQLVNIPINYVDLNSGQTVGTVSDYGMSGKPFNDKSRTNVPNGYTYDRINGSLPVDYAPNEAVSVFVTKVPTNHNGNHQNNNQPFSMPVNYVYNGQTKGTVYTAPEVAGTNFDPTNYEHNIPTGYQFADYPTSNPNVYERGHAVTIDVTPFSSKPDQTVHMPVQYISNGKIVGTKTATGTEGSPFDPTQFEQGSNVPSGYQYTDGNVNKPQNFEPNSIVQISVDPINNSHLVRMPIKYVDNGQVKGTSMAPGMSGTPITPSDLSPYEQNVPSGYKYDNGQIQAPANYTDGQTITIPIVPLPKGQTVASMPISYVSNGKQVGTATATGVNGALFNPTQYENNVPRGYYYNSQDDSIQPMVNKYANGTRLTINVDPIPQGKQVADMTVDYMNGNQLVNSQSANGISGAPFNVKPFEHAMNLLPHGYKFAGFNGNVPQTYTNGATISIRVTPKKQPSNSTQSTITVNYVNGNQTIESEPVTGWSGQPFDLSNYQSITPGGYRYVATPQGSNVTKFTPNNQTVEIEVEPNQPTTKYGTITVQYRDEDNGSLMTNDNYPMTEAVGDPFSLSTFDEAPSGYHITGVYSGNASQFTGTPQYVVLNVAPDNQNNNANNNHHGSNSNQNSGHNSQPVTPQYGTITIQCVDPSGQNVGVSNTTNDKVGTPFNLSTALRVANIPSNYHIVGLLSGNNVSQYTAGNQFVDVEVAPNQSTSASSSATSANVNPAPQSQSSSSTNAGNVNPQPTDNNNTANPSFNPNFDPSFNPVINNTVPQSHNNGSASANPINNNRSNGYVPNSNVAQPTSGSTNNSNDPVHFASNNTNPTNSSNGTSTSQQTPNNTVSHRNTQGANDVMPSPRHNQSLGSGNGRRTASGQNTPASDNNDGSDQGNAGSNQLGIRHSQGAGNGPANYGQQNQEQLDAATHMNNGSTNGVANSNAGSNSQQPANSFNGSRLPQTGERNDDMAAILMALGSSLSALGYAIEKRRRRYHMGRQANRFNNK